MTAGSRSTRSVSAENAADFPALRLVKTPRAPRILARALAVALVAAIVALLVVPWRQTAAGTGRVVALDPLDRPQVIEAPISGMIDEWYVREASRVRAGDPLVKLRDNDPQNLERLQVLIDVSEEKYATAEAKASTYRDQIEMYKALRENELSMARSGLEIARQKLTGAEQELEAKEANKLLAQQIFDRKTFLRDNSLASKQDVEVAKQNLDAAVAALAKAVAEVQAAAQDVTLKTTAIESKRADADAKVAEARAKLQAAEGDVAVARESVVKAEREQSRFLTQVVKAPRDGTVVRLLASQGAAGMQLKEGDALIEFVPDAAARAAELYIDGNDAPWISPGRSVRLQFEGWPAVQFAAGWPSFALGTYGGRVVLVDATDDGMGRFRVLVEPDPNDQPWPGSGENVNDVRRELRQGVRCNGWVLLNQVPLGYEFWRQLNGFPPLTTPGKDEEPKSKAKPPLGKQK